MTTISIRLDDDMKRELDQMCEEMGMNLTTFFTIYAKRALRDRKIPFEVTAPADPFVTERNQAQIRKAYQQVLDGQTVSKSFAELEAMAHE